MKLILDPADQEALVSAIVEAVIARLGDQTAGGRIGMLEPEAAAALGVPRHRLRDARLRGVISARKLGSSYIYSVEDLKAWLRVRE